MFRGELQMNLKLLNIGNLVLINGKVTSTKYQMTMISIIENKMKRTSKVKKQIFLFLPIGFFTVFLDYCSYLFILNYFNIHFAKAVGFFTGTLFSYFANKTITFRYKKNVKKSFVKFYILYFFSMCMNVIINSSINHYFNNFQRTFILSFFISTGCSAILNFFGMKYYVFKNS